MARKLVLKANVTFDQNSDLFIAKFKEIPQLAGYDTSKEEAIKRLLWLLTTWMEDSKEEVNEFFSRISVSQQPFQNIEIVKRKNTVHENVDEVEMAIS